MGDWHHCCGQASYAIGGIGCACEPPVGKKIARNTSTPESRAFWDGIIAISETRKQQEAWDRLHRAPKRYVTYAGELDE